MNIYDFSRMKKEGRKISMVTAYDHWMARIVEKSPLDCALVGDSLAMVVHGHPSTIHATPEMMALHTQAVSRAIKSKFLVADMPFLTFRKGIVPALECVDLLMKAGAHSVKLEGVTGHEPAIAAIVGSGVPVMGHIGLTPQSIHQLGGFKVQGRQDAEARSLLEQARRLEELGCFALVLECVPAAVARQITESLRIPTIGIGAGTDVDGQVLVLQDLLGADSAFKPKFLRKYANLERDMLDALERYHGEVVARSFPSESESYL